MQPKPLNHPLTGLFVPGYACRSDIWNAVRDEFDPAFETTLVDWPKPLAAGFGKVEDFSDWLSASYELNRYDFIAGHSMGGLVALQALAGLGQPKPKLILVESFLISPGPFFQNLVMPGTAPEVEAGIQQMLQQERDYYAPNLRQSLQNVDYTGQVTRLKTGIAAIYGDRGSHNAERVQRELGWPEMLMQKVPVRFVQDACHFPMVENPAQTAAWIHQILL